MNNAHGLNEKLAILWTRLNPVEASNGYLIKMMAVFVGLFLLAGIIGRVW